MSKRNRLRQQVEAAKDTVPVVKQTTVGLKLGTHQFKNFEGSDAAFGARLVDYPPMSIVPDGFKGFYDPYSRVVSSLFYSGGKIEDFGLTVKSSISTSQFYIAIRAMLTSWDLQHEHKTAVVAWALSEWCDGTPKVAA